MKIVFTARAEKDLENIYSYLFEVAPHVADKIVLAIISKTEQLITTPYQHPKNLF